MPPLDARSPRRSLLSPAPSARDLRSPPRGALREAAGPPRWKYTVSTTRLQQCIVSRLPAPSYGAPGTGRCGRAPSCTVRGGANGTARCGRVGMARGPEAAPRPVRGWCGRVPRRNPARSGALTAGGGGGRFVPGFVLIPDLFFSWGFCCGRETLSRSCSHARSKLYFILFFFIICNPLRSATRGYAYAGYTYIHSERKPQGGEALPALPPDGKVSRAISPQHFDAHSLNRNKRSGAEGRSARQP